MMILLLSNIIGLKYIYSAFQIDELHRHNQNLVGTLHKGVPTVVYRHENCRKMTIVTAREVKIFEMSNKRNKP